MEIETTQTRRTYKIILAELIRKFVMRGSVADIEVRHEKKGKKEEPYIAVTTVEFKEE